MSIYLRDPAGNMVEFCHTVRDFTPEERARAVAVLSDPRPAFDAPAVATLHDPIVAEPVAEPVAGG